jgi:hypothetical protein
VRLDYARRTFTDGDGHHDVPFAWAHVSRRQAGPTPGTPAAPSSAAASARATPSPPPPQPRPAARAMRRASPK